ncbi:MAG: hypothetical protein INQ03_24010 [Candidatus Heimdallarchaeota archaeon]|nr:hypothetical protein [Candidatus Heimdallarchaeota archaeon]
MKELFYLKDDGVIKEIRSKHYNTQFNRENGLFLRWGKNLEDDPDYSPIGPELLDIEISAGKCSGNCPFCYKSNNLSKTNEVMSFELFRNLMRILPISVNQIAFGITDLDSNSDMWRIMEYAREKGVIPNYTCNGKQVTEDIAKRTAKICGAVAVSMYNRDECYNAVQKFCNAGMVQVNIHYMLAEETLEEAFEVIDDIVTDTRLTDLYGIIFLQYKPHGRGIGSFTPIKNLMRFNQLLKKATDMRVSFGFDSCTSPIYMKSIEKDQEFHQKVEYVEPCESGLFSLYCNTKAEFFPCSFMEGENGWENGLKSDHIKDFSELWNHERLIAWRKQLINSSKHCECDLKIYCRSCPNFISITTCKEIKLQAMD